MFAGAAATSDRPACAAPSLTPEEGTAFIDKTAKALVDVVNGAGATAEKQEALKTIIETSVDGPGVARFSLGRFWRTATPQQQTEFISLFEKALVANLGGKLGDYRGVTYALLGTRRQGEDIIVASTVTRPGNQPNKVDWVVSRGTGSPKIVDVVVEGTSLRLTQRSDYSAYLASHGNDVQALIDAIRQQVNHPSS
jgi:phospholipid transport system substrate-binding protein